MQYTIWTVISPQECSRVRRCEQHRSSDISKHRRRRRLRFDLDIESENPHEVARQVGAQARIADVTDRSSLQSAFADFVVPDIVVINAGIGRLAPVSESTPDLWDRPLAVNLTGAFHTLQIAGQRMRNIRQGSIVLTASTNSSMEKRTLSPTTPAKQACSESSDRCE